MDCVFLYNPNSGRGKIKRKTAEIEQRLRGLFDKVNVFETKSAADMTQKAREWADKGATIVFAGGDGTFNAVLEGVAGRDVALGYLPAGTANDAAGSLGIPKRMRRALNMIARGRTVKFDCMQINGKRYAFCIVAAGSLTRVTYETPQRRKRFFGWFAYAAAVLKRLWREKPFYVEAESGGVRASGNFALALIMNGKRVARFPLNRAASMRDGRCETVLVRQFGEGVRARWSARAAIVRLVLFGAKCKGKRYVWLCGERVKIAKSDSVLWDFDGERGLKGEIDVRVLRGAVRVFVPK